MMISQPLWWICQALLVRFRFVSRVSSEVSVTEI